MCSTGGRTTAALIALTLTQFAWSGPHNFGGTDEWLVLSLLSRGIVGFPYAFRPLGLAWALPAWWLAPGSLTALWALHAFYIGAAGVFLFLTLRRLWPEAAGAAFLAAAFSIAWAPTDVTRLSSVQMIVYSGCTMGTAAAVWLYTDSWARGSVLRLAAAALVGTVAVLAHEAALPPLAIAPVLVYLARDGCPELRARRVRWAWAWGGFLVLCALRLTAGLLAGGEASRYQSTHLAGHATVTGILANVAARLLDQLGPLFANAALRGDLAAVLAASVVFVAGALAVARGGLALPLRAGAAGLAWAVLAHLPFAISTVIRDSGRTQFLSAPGVALALAVAVCALARVFPRRGGPAVALVLSAWVIAQGTAHTLAFQRHWDGASAFPAQRRTLAQIVALAPGLEPGTLLILLGDRPAWPLDLAFRHAVAYLYDGGAVGHAPDAPAFLYATRFDADAIVSEPDPVIRGPWHDPVRRFRYDEVVVMRAEADGRVGLLDAWPADLPLLPPGARYVPRARIRSGPPSARTAIVTREEAP